MAQPGQFLIQLDPQIIQRIEILNPIDAQFAYGSIAGNGAVVITTH